MKQLKKLTEEKFTNQNGRNREMLGRIHLVFVRLEMDQPDFMTSKKYKMMKKKKCRECRRRVVRTAKLLSFLVIPALASRVDDVENRL